MDIAFLDFVKAEDAIFHYTRKATALKHILPTKVSEAFSAQGH